MRVIVFGASGVQGAAQVAALSRAGHTPIAVSRNPQPLQVNGKTIETAALDYNDPTALSQVMHNAQAIFLNLPSTSFSPSAPILCAATAIGQAAAASPSVRLLVFNTSMPVPAQVQNIKAQDDRRAMRAALRDTGVPVASIQPVCYLDNLLAGWALPPIRDRSTVVYCHHPGLRASWICHDDVASLMIAAMEAGPERMAGRDFAVGGPETVRLCELAGRLSRAWGREMGCENQTVDDFCEKISATMSGRGLESERIVGQMHMAYTWYNENPEFVVDMKPVLEELPCKLTTIEEWGRSHVPEFTT